MPNLRKPKPLSPEELAVKAVKVAEAKALEIAKNKKIQEEKERINEANAKINNFCIKENTSDTVFKEFKKLLGELPKITEELSRLFGWTHNDDKLLKKYIENESTDVNWILCLTTEQLQDLIKFWETPTEEYKKQIKEVQDSGKSGTLNNVYNIRYNKDAIKHALQFMEDKTKNDSFKGTRAKKIWETLEQLMGIIENQIKSKELDIISISGIHKHMEDTKKEARRHEEEMMKNTQPIKPNKRKNKYLKYKMKYLKLKKELNL